MNRKQRRASGRAGAGAAAASTIRPASSGALAELFAAAVTHHQAGELLEAERRYRHILTLAPNHAEAHSRLGSALMALGKISEAIAHLERALALKPDLFEASGNVAQAYLWSGQGERAIAAAQRTLELGETDNAKVLFAQCIRFARFTPTDNRARKLVVRALTEGWAPPRELTGVCLGLIKLDSAVADGVARARAAWPERPPAAQLLGPSGLAALAQDRLLCRLLECDPIPDPGLERLLTNVRHAMLTSVADGECDDDLLDFCCSVARQCFVNEYVYSMTVAEADRAQQLRTMLDEALADAGPCPAFWPAAVGAYFPLHTLKNADAMLDRPWPPCVDAVIAQQIKEPAQQRRIAATIPALTAIDDEVSRVVRQQYEENPYPRWVKTGPLRQPAGRGGGQPVPNFDVLIAGCGTGLSTIEFALQAPHARVVAIDLSLASLSYAKRMAQSYGLTNVEFGQADIVRLAAIGRQFDCIDACGVLHHLADPWEGWRVLLTLLRPGGTMQVGLYSEVARRNVVAARALIGKRGYRPIPEDIRRCREEVAAADDASVLKSLTRSSDFFTTSECRDLLFHPQEHRVTLPQIKAFLAENDLKFAGFVLAPSAAQKFAARFPERSAMTDLDCWHVFETEAPDTFGSMYVFSVHKPVASSDKQQ